MHSQMANYSSIPPLFHYRPHEPQEGPFQPAGQLGQQLLQRAVIAPPEPQQQQQIVVFARRPISSGKPGAARLRELVSPQPGPSGIRPGPSAQSSNATTSRKRPRDQEPGPREPRGGMRQFLSQEIVKMIKMQKHKMQITISLDLDGSEVEPAINLE